MAPSTTSEKITLTYPIFSADFLDPGRLIVGGGGGEGRSGVGNKITLLDVSKSSSTQSQTSTQIKQLAEVELSRSEDSCMSLAVTRAPPQKKNSKEKPTPPKLLAGINSSEQQQLGGKNEHFRVFSINLSERGQEIAPLSKLQLFTPTSGVELYQRVLRTRGLFAALASGGGATGFEIVVVSTTDFTALTTIKTESEVADLDLADDGSLIYCTTKEIFTTPASYAKPTKLSFQPSPPIPGTLRSIRFLTRERIIVVINLPQRTGAELLLLDITTGAIITRKKLHKGIKAVTGLDAVDLYGDGNSAVAVAGADQSVEVLVVEKAARIQHAQIFRSVHPFQISKVVFAPPPPPPLSANSPVSASADVEDEKKRAEYPTIRLATTSIGNTVVVFTLPLIHTTAAGYTLLRSGVVARQTAISVLLSLVAVGVFAMFLQIMFLNRVGLVVPQGISELLPPIQRTRGGFEAGEVKIVDAQTDGFIRGLKSGAASDPFGQDDVVDGEALRGEVLREAGGIGQSEGKDEKKNEEKENEERTDGEKKDEL